MEDEHLAVAVGAGADADRRDRERARDPRATGAGSLSRTTAKQPGRSSASASAISCRAASAVRPCTLKPPSIVADCGVSPMCPMTGIPAPTIASTRGDHRAGALELDGVRAALLDEADRVAHRVLVGDLVGAERQVATTADGSARRATARVEEEHVLHRDRDRRVVAEDDHRRRVADEDDVDPGGLASAPLG